MVFPILLVVAVITTGVMGAFLAPNVPALTATPTRIASIRPPALPPLVPPPSIPPAAVPPSVESGPPPPAAVPPLPPVAEPEDAGPEAADDLTLTFPLRGDCLLTASFGDPRPGGRRHEGEDVMAPKMTPVIAVADGTVAWLRSAVGSTCCAVTLRHDDGWSSRYLHLNNDSPGTDDNQGYGLVPGLAVGTRLTAGSVIGWVGDSGNAEQKAPHLHFELRDPAGRPVDPYPTLKAAAVQVEAQGYLIRSLRPAESD